MPPLYSIPKNDRLTAVEMTPYDDHHPGSHTGAQHLRDPTRR